MNELGQVTAARVDTETTCYPRRTQVTYGNGVVDRKSHSGPTGNFRLSAIQTWKGTTYYSPSHEVI